MEFKRRRYNHSYLNIAPLVDVVFLLLLFFMLTSHFIEEQSIRVRLPESRTSEYTERAGIKIFINEKGDVILNRKKVKVEDLHTLLKEQLPLEKTKNVEIRADRDVKVSLLMRVIDEIRLSGINDFNIVTEKAY
ncbi:MAG: biopolymer transporter ExbD [Nitrospirae bacterium]|nr:biopolymer transporter ExbD [Nitrospirota bacterium]